MFSKREQSEGRESRQEQAPKVSSLQEMIFQVLVGGEKYGLEIRDAIEERFQKNVALGSLYAALDGMEREGWVESRMGEATEERGGNRRKYFKLTGSGCRRYDDLRTTGGFPDVGGLVTG